MIDLYILNSCPYCKKVMKFMDENNIEYRKFDTINSDNALRLMSLGGKDQVPFLHNEDTDEKLYDSDKIIEYLEKQV
ncbi:glutathione S-transferase N-terminal domain-containing protein [bacterium]|nr:glutathione S-transferase N-terminal domain-containing protein [bacterium]